MNFHQNLWEIYIHVTPVVVAIVNVKDILIELEEKFKNIRNKLLKKEQILN